MSNQSGITRFSHWPILNFNFEMKGKGQKNDHAAQKELRQGCGCTPQEVKIKRRWEPSMFIDFIYLLLKSKIWTMSCFVPQKTIAALWAGTPAAKQAKGGDKKRKNAEDKDSASKAPRAGKLSTLLF